MKNSAFGGVKRVRVGGLREFSNLLRFGVFGVGGLGSGGWSQRLGSGVGVGGVGALESRGVGFGGLGLGGWSCGRLG